MPTSDTVVRDRRFVSVRLRSADVTRFSEKRDKRASHHCGDQGHNYEHGENPLREDTHIITYIEGNEFHQSTRVHQCAELKRLPPFHSSETGRQGASTELPRSGYRYNDQADEPILSAVEETNLSAQTGESKEHWQQQDGAQVLDSHNQFVPETICCRHDYSCQKRPEERMNPDEFRAYRR